MTFIQGLKRFLHPKCLARLTQMEYTILPNNNPRPRITVPHRMMRKIEKIKVKQATKKHQQKASYKGPLIISCKRKQFDHYHKQTYSDFSPEKMASGGWKHRGSVGDYFTINAYQSNPAVDLAEDAPSSFTELGVGMELVHGLEQMGITTPTNIQALTIPEVLQGANALCLAETGSGKTLAYLLPIFEKIKRHQKVFGKTNESNAPYAVILVPSRELAEQIHKVCGDLGKFVGIESHCVIGGHGTQILLKRTPRTHMDILISTPGVLAKLLSRQLYQMNNLLQIILDEADTLLDDSFNDVTMKIISKLKVTSEKLELQGSVSTIGTQMALVGVTLPRDLENILGDVVPIDTVKLVRTDHIHRLMPHVTQKFMRVSKSKKPELFLQTVMQNVKRKVPTIVFCNTNATSCFLSYFLEDNLVPHVLLNSAITRAMREGKFKKFQEGEVDVLICTDIASRGLDTIRVQHVINYDFPDFISDYIHRTGRVGRVASLASGYCLSFIANPWEVDLLWIIETSVRKVSQLHNVNANIKRKLEGKHFKDSLKYM